MSRKIPFLGPSPECFPDLETALDDPDGLLAAGGSLDPKTMVCAYSSAIFPWFSEGDPILWWSPSERAVIEPSRLEISRSLSKTLRNKPWEVRLDADFGGMVDLCAQAARRGQGPGTWIVPKMREAYRLMHDNGLAHSVEVFLDGEFAGGLFGIKLGGMFYGESMASLRPDASKVALAYLCLAAPELGVELVDCQMMTRHLSSMGAEPIARSELRARVSLLAQRAKPESWKERLASFDLKAALEACKAGRTEHEASVEKTRGRSLEL